MCPKLKKLKNFEISGLFLNVSDLFTCAKLQYPYIQNREEMMQFIQNAKLFLSISEVLYHILHNDIIVCYVLSACV